MTRLLVCLGAVLLGGCAQQMVIDPGKITSAQATLRLESPELAKYIAIPLMTSKVVNVTLSTFGGCSTDGKQEPKMADLGKATLTPKHNAQSVDIPANAELAIYAESAENAGGNMYSCGRAVRFQSEVGGQYVLHFTPHGSIHRAICQMSLLETRDGKDMPVASAHVAVMERAGFWKGGGLKFCVP